MLLCFSCRHRYNLVTGESTWTQPPCIALAIQQNQYDEYYGQQAEGAAGAAAGAGGGEWIAATDCLTVADRVAAAPTGSATAEVHRREEKQFQVDAVCNTMLAYEEWRTREFEDEVKALQAELDKATAQGAGAIGALELINHVLTREGSQAALRAAADGDAGEGGDDEGKEGDVVLPRLAGQGSSSALIALELEEEEKQFHGREANYQSEQERQEALVHRRLAARKRRCVKMKHEHMLKDIAQRRTQAKLQIQQLQQEL